MLAEEVEKEVDNENNDNDKIYAICYRQMYVVVVDVHFDIENIYSLKCIIYSISLPLLNGMIRRHCFHRCCCSPSSLFANCLHYLTLSFPTTTFHSPCITISSNIVVSANALNNSSPSFINI